MDSGVGKVRRDGKERIVQILITLHLVKDRRYSIQVLGSMFLRDNWSIYTNPKI